MSLSVDVDLVVPASAKLGECPLWSPIEHALYWVDIDGRAVHRFDPDTSRDEARPIEMRPGSIGLTDRPGLLVMAGENRFGVFSWSKGTMTSWMDLAPLDPDVRLNDGKCDPGGRFWTGSMHDPAEAGMFEGVLFRIDSPTVASTIRTEIGVSNGLAFSPEGDTMYFADTLRDSVWAFDYDVDDGSMSNERLFIDFDDLPGRPDGATVDTTGCYWVACVHGSAVARIAPNGDIDRIVELPIQQPTMPAFGGDDLSTMYVTSLGGDGVGKRTSGEPRSGDLIAFDPGVDGLIEPSFTLGAGH